MQAQSFDSEGREGHCPPASIGLGCLAGYPRFGLLRGLSDRQAGAVQVQVLPAQPQYRVHPAQAGLSTKRFQNIKSDLKAALDCVRLGPSCRLGLWGFLASFWEPAECAGLITATWD